jgi:hypothetical protein
MPELCNQKPVHFRTAPANPSQGASKRTRQGAKTARSLPRKYAPAPPNGRASVWHIENADGIHPLSNQDATERPYGNEPTCFGLQS